MLDRVQLDFLTNKLCKVKTKKYTISKKTIVRKIFYRLRTGCQWRALGKHWKDIWYHYRKWLKNNLLDGLLLELSIETNNDIYITDTQSIKNTCLSNTRGIDGHKKVKGIKIIIIVNTIGQIIYSKVYPANYNDKKIMKLTLNNINTIQKKNITILADKGFESKELENLYYNIKFKPMKTRRIRNKSFHPIALDITLQEKDKYKSYNKEISLIRYIVERTFAWLQNFRLLNLNYERKAESHNGFIKLASIYLSLRRKRC